MRRDSLCSNVMHFCGGPAILPASSAIGVAGVSDRGAAPTSSNAVALKTRDLITSSLYARLPGVETPFNARKITGVADYVDRRSTGEACNHRRRRNRRLDD